MKQSTTTNCPSDEIIMKLIYSGDESDFKIGVELLLRKNDMPLTHLGSLEYFFFKEKRGTWVFKDTSSRQKEIILGQTGFIVRSLRQNNCSYEGVKIRWI